MKFRLLLLVSCSLWLLATGVYANQQTVFEPHRVSHKELVEDSAFEEAQESFLHALQQDGIVSVTRVPSFYKRETLATLHECALTSKTTQEHTYHDGTRRRTLATQSAGRVQTAVGGGGDATECTAFNEASKAFRQQVDATTQLFTQRLSSLLSYQEEPLLLRLSEESDGEVYDTLQSVVEHGQHLEHFHSYQRHENSGEESPLDTIDIHTDQGLLLVFCPALLVENSKVLETMKDGFYVQRQDGTRARVEFDESDDLVFMLGDGVNQYVNPSIDQDQQLYATPHAVSMPVLSNPHQARVWYGRMVLPPSNALIHGETFGSLRQANMQGNRKDLACSSYLEGRQLEELSCEADELFCWEKCMIPAEYNVSESMCKEQGLNLTCTNDEGQLYISGHGQFYPGCIDLATATNVTGSPIHPSLQNNTNITDDNGDGHTHDGDDHTHDGDDEHGGEGEMTMMSGSLFAGSFVMSIMIAGIVGVVMV